MDAKRLFYVMCASLVLTTVGVGYGLYWANSQLKLRAVEISKLNADSDALETQITNARQLRDELENYQDIAVLTKEVLPDIKGQENIVGELISIASKRNIKLESINFISGGGTTTSTNPELSQAEKVDDINGVFQINIQTSFRTSYTNTLQVLRDLENNKRRFEVTNISISPNQSENGSVNDFSASIDIATYIKPE